MNIARRKQIADAKAILESVRDEEQAALDNLPDSFRDGERGEKMEAAVDALEEAISQLETIE